MHTRTGGFDWQVERWTDFAPVDRYTERWSVLLEFSIAPMVAASALGHYRPTTIEVSLDPQRRLSLKFSGALADECTCDLVRAAAELNEDAVVHPAKYHRLMGRFAGYVEGYLETEWTYIIRTQDRSCRCDDCGMICCAPENFLGPMESSLYHAVTALQ
ncbi:hypothetical protein LTR36_010010 [Oleoguttula mirabilis]|uniref:Uncharacterized protein n=1 Tax=Oleoguttula mirabilis TaxID=1507867 RepID=A0AAV9JRW4_9PEZI|nr:hypothetical protein LTR36_010010 [Oleoguttula mirabilis]